MSFAFLLLMLCTFAVSSASAQVQLPEPNPADPITISAQAGNQWRSGEYEVWILRGNFILQQGQACARANEAVLWIDRAEATERRPNKVLLYLEGDASIASDPRSGAAQIKAPTWYGRFSTSANVFISAPMTAGMPDVVPPIYERAMNQRDPNTGLPGIQQTQYTAPATTPAPAPPVGGSTTFPATRPSSPEAKLTPVPQMSGPASIISNGRRIRVFPRSDVPVQFNWYPDPSGHLWTAVIDSGVNVIVDGLSAEIGTLGFSTDRMVIWTTGKEAPDLKGQTRQDEREPLEFYMEGNTVFRQGERTIYADRLYYDVPNNVGTILNADLYSPAKGYQGLLHLHTQVLQRTGKDHYYAKDTYITSSLMGEPSYRLQSGDLYLEDIQQPIIDPATGEQQIDPTTGNPAYDTQRLATSGNNLLFMGPVPVFYWPMIATDLNEPTYYIRHAQFKNDNVFGTQVRTDWSGYELLGIRNRPKGTDLGVSLDYLSKRGLGHGASFNYNRESTFLVPGHYEGLTDYWGIQDSGLDTLGQGRTAVPPGKDYRFRWFWQHRQLLPYDMQLSAEFGWISDQNFLEEYFKREWDTLKDESTGVELKRLSGITSWSITADYRMNDFVTQTDWLPRADHFWIGQSLFDTFTWYEHSNVGYAELQQTVIPADSSVGPITGANGPFNYLPWEANGGKGERLASRQEVDWPFQLGPVKIVPYLLGEAAHWGEDVDGQSLDRLFGQAGLRATLPIWSVDPTYNSDLFNVHGLAHKVVFDIEFATADANKDLTQLPLYDALDDNSVEAFRRRFLTNTFGIPSLSPLPSPAGTPWVSKFDERLYALRSGLQNWVNSSSTEIADDLTTIRLGANQRWQTKRGPVNNRHIIDWITLDTNMTFFPESDRDNYGAVAGLLDYDFAWHVGDRVTLVSDGLFDCFADGQKIVSVGGFLSRPPRGSLYMGFRILDGPIDNQILSVAYSYWMSPKWVSTLGATVDLGNEGNIGESFTVTRIGESFLTSVVFSADPSRDSVGIGLIVEPRFASKTRTNTIAGAQIPPAGAFGLE